MLCSVSERLLAAALVVGAVIALPQVSVAQSARRDGIAELITREQSASRFVEATGDGTATGGAATAQDTIPAAEAADPREGDPAYEQAHRLMQAVDAILKDTAEQRADVRKLPARDEFLVTPIWTETREDRETRVRALLDSVLGIVTDVPVVDLQKRIEGHRKAIRDLDDRIATLREKRIMAPRNGTLPGILTDTMASLDAEIADCEKQIAANQEGVTKAKTEITDALTMSGVKLEVAQLDLLLDSVLSSDLVRMVAAFNAAKLIDGQLATLMQAAGDNTGAARKYFAMHAALFAMLVHAQDSTIGKIDTQYLPRLDAILKDLAAANAKTSELMRAENRPDQRRVLDANRESQRIAEDAAKGYRRYLQQQREQIAKARSRATHDLRIADNTYETVEASFQLHTLMRSGQASFEALQKLEAPTFDQIFKNEELRREFESLTRRLDAPSS